MSRIPEEKYQKAISMIKNGTPQKDACIELGISRSAMQAKFRKLGISVESLQSGYTKNQNVIKHRDGKFQGVHSKAYIMALAAEYKNWAGVAKHLGVNTNIIRIWCCKNEIYIREITGKTRTDKGARENSDIRKTRRAIYYSEATIKDLAIRRPWFGGALCL